MRAYAQVAGRAQERAELAQLDEIRRQLATEQDAERLAELWSRLFDTLRGQRRYRCLVVEARRALAHPPQPSPKLPQPVSASAQGWLVHGLEMLSEDDAALREGEIFLATYPRSTANFHAVRKIMDAIIDAKRARENGLKVVQAYDDNHMWMPGEKADPCKLGSFYDMHHLLPEARTQLEACIAQPHPVLLAQQVHLLAQVTMELGDFAAAQRYLDQLRAHFPNEYRAARALEEEMPVAGGCTP
jgi:hypothetical protein